MKSSLRMNTAFHLAILLGWRSNWRDFYFLTKFFQSFSVPQDDLLSLVSSVSQSIEARGDLRSLSLNTPYTFLVENETEYEVEFLLTEAERSQIEKAEHIFQVNLLERLRNLKIDNC